MRSRYGGFWIRLLAHGVDELLILLVTSLCGLALLGALYWIGKGADVKVGGVELQLFLATTYLALALAYYTGMHCVWGATFGKKLFGLKVVNRADHGPLSLTQAALRCLAYLCSLPLGMGFLLIGLEPERRALHDLLSGTVVLRDRGAAKTEKSASAGAALVLVFVLLALPGSGAGAADAEHLNPYFQVLVAAQTPGTGVGAELAGAAWFKPLSEHELVLGPRLGVGTSTSATSRWTLLPGMETILWIGNAMGPGMGMGPLLTISGGTPGEPIRFFWEGFLAVRLLHFQDDGAWGLRMGAFYDTSEKWAFRLALTLQLNGVSVNPALTRSASSGPPDR